MNPFAPFVPHKKTLRLQAERRLGEMLRAMPKATGAKGIGTSVVPLGNRTLDDMGIDKKTSMRAQRQRTRALSKPFAGARLRTTAALVRLKFHH